MTIKKNLSVESIDFNTYGVVYLVNHNNILRRNYMRTRAVALCHYLATGKEWRAGNPAGCYGVVFNECLRSSESLVADSNGDRHWSDLVNGLPVLTCSCDIRGAVLLVSLSLLVDGRFSLQVSYDGRVFIESNHVLWQSLVDEMGEKQGEWLALLWDCVVPKDGSAAA